MAITLSSSSQESVSVEDYIDFVDANLNPDDLDSVCSHADVFGALLNNRSLMTDSLNDELSGWRDFQTNNDYSAQTFILGRSSRFVIRANVWAPPAARNSEEREWEDRFYAYRLPHDHNFSFLTGGYYGSGYETTLYEYDPTTIVGNVGERVDLTFLEKTRLPKGKIMLYRASRDIHSQEHAEDFSISVNLLFVRPQDSLVTQWMFDLEQQTLVAPLQNRAAAQSMLCEVARHVGDQRTIALLDDLSNHHPNPRFRFHTLDVLSDLSGDATIWERGLRDVHPYVREQVEARLSGPLREE